VKGDLEEIRDVPGEIKSSFIIFRVASCKFV
jgi:hypothetical protein